MSRPAMRMAPVSTVLRDGSSRIMARKVTLLPEPDSPMMPITSPGRIVKLTWFTACTVASRETKRTHKSRTSTSGGGIGGSPAWGGAV